MSIKFDFLLRKFRTSDSVTIDPGVVPDASTSAKGIVQLATGAEVTAGTNTAKAVVPSTLKTELDKKVAVVAGKGLSTNDYDNTEKAKVAAALTSIPDASTSAKGIIQLATGAEVTTGTDSFKAVVPSTLKTELDKKVTVVAGKGLSTNDYDNTEKDKVAAAETKTSLGIDTSSGDTTKFLNQKGSWAVPGGGGGGSTGVELLSSMPTPTVDDLGRVALFSGSSTSAYIENKLYRVMGENTVSATGSVVVSVVTYGAQGTYAFLSGSGDTRKWWKRVGEQEWNIFYSSGAWVIHSFGWEYDETHMDEYRAVAAAGSNPWDSGLTWESSWDEGMSGVGGATPTVAGSATTSYVWRLVGAPLTVFTTGTVPVYPGGRYKTTHNSAFNLVAEGYAGCYGDAEVIIEVGASTVVTAGGGLVLVDSLAANKRNYCVVKFYGTVAKLFVVHTEGL